MSSPLIRVYLKPEISTPTSLEILRQLRRRASGRVLLCHKPGAKCFCFVLHPDVYWLVKNWRSALAGISDDAVPDRRPLMP